MNPALEIVLISVLSLTLVALFGETIHCRLLDWAERRAVQNAWEGCISVARASAPSWAAHRAIIYQADELFMHLSEARRERGQDRLPSHLLGIPAADLIRRYS